MGDVFNDEFKRLIVGRSRTILERVEQPEYYENGLRDEETAAKAYKNWKDVFPNDSILDARLERDNLTRGDFERAAQMDKLDDDAPLPDWIDRLDDIVESVLAFEPEEIGGSSGSHSQSDEHPFIELLEALALTAKETLNEKGAIKHLDYQAIDTMMDWFVKRARRRFVQILFVEFKTFVANHDEQLAFADPEEFDEPPTEYYQKFLEYMFSGGFAEFCQEYPVFCRLLVCQTRQWKEHLEEFASRLFKDKEALGQRFADSGEIGSVESLEPLADDTHGDGRAIMRVNFTSGVTVVYKPRSVDAGESFYSVLDQLNDHLQTPDFKTPAYLVRDDYGWMEWVESSDCETTQAVERYYQRAGSLICLTYLLNFTDCQYENLIVSGEQPVLVDTDTVCAPHFETDKRSSRNGTGILMYRSVLLTMLLPTGSSGEGQLSDLGEATSGYSTSAEEQTVEGITNSVVTEVNTDVMDVEQVPAKFDRSENIPMVEGEAFLPENHLDGIIHGFTHTYRTVMNLRDADKLEEIGLPNAFESVENRVVWRPTIRYGSCIDAMSSRLPLHGGSWAGAEIERLALPFFNGRVNSEDIWPIYKAEREKMRQFEPPRFSCRANETQIRMNDSLIGIEVDTPGIEMSRERIDTADREDMLKQIEFIRGAFGVTPDPEKAEYNDITPDRQPVSDDNLRTEAKHLFGTVHDATIQVDSGQRHLSSIAPRSESPRLALKPGDHSLYYGRPGPAIFAAGLYSIYREHKYRVFAEELLRATRAVARGDQVAPVMQVHGGTNGLGAVAYSLSVAGDLLDDSSMKRDAGRVGEFVTEETLENDDTFDVSGGAAGTILGLLAANDRLESDDLIEAAKACGDHLLENRVQAPDGNRVWKTLEDCPPLTGFAHGAGGIAYALTRLADSTGYRRYSEAAREALEFEHGTYSQSDCNWPEHRTWVNSRFHDQWCYGRSGIGLARLGLLKYADWSIIHTGIDRAIESAPRTGLKDFDHLCCGEAGRIEFLLEAASDGFVSESRAQELAGAILSRKEQSGTYRTQDGTNRITNPTLFHGISGIGYTLLRVSAPDQLPNVLLWE